MTGAASSVSWRPSGAEGKLLPLGQARVHLPPTLADFPAGGCRRGLGEDSESCCTVFPGASHLVVHPGRSWALNPSGGLVKSRGLSANLWQARGLLVGGLLLLQVAR